MPNPFETSNVDSKDAIILEEMPKDKFAKSSLSVVYKNSENTETDMTYDTAYQTNENEEGIDIQNEQVKDRWSRYIGAMGIEAVAKQAVSRILLCELGPLGIEIAKNIVLAGCKELVIYEKFVKPDIEADIMSGQFFLTQEDIGKESRALACKHKIQELNRYVKVTVVEPGKFLTA